MEGALALVFVLLALGYVLARTGVLQAEVADGLNRYVVYVCLPALVLRLLPRLTWDASVLQVLLVPWCMLLISGALVLLAARHFAWPRPVVGALLLCVPIGNTSFLGIPLISALRGEHAVRYAVVYDQLGSFLMLSTYGLFVLGKYSGEGSPSLSVIARRVVQFPPFIACVVALLPWPHPALLDAVLQRIADTLVPVAVFAVGLRLRARPPKEGSALACGLGIKMLVCPLLALLVLRGLDQRDLAAHVAVLEAAMPPSISAGALASSAGLAPELCAALVGYGVVIAFGSVTLFATALH